MAFSADELRVLRRALAAALRPAPPPAPAPPSAPAPAPGAASSADRPDPARSDGARTNSRRTSGSSATPRPYGAPLSPARAAEVREYAQLAAAVEEAVREGARLRSFQRTDLARYRAALPGSAAGYLTHLRDALAVGYLPRSGDLDALRTLPALAATAAEADRRTALLRHCEHLAQQAVRARLLGFRPQRRPRSSVSRRRTAPKTPQSPKGAVTG
jgi:hypothetical protein